jgi:leucyl-tRNA synthetase
VHQLTTAAQKKAVDAYLREVATKSDLQRTDLAKEKTGVWTGAYAINPVNHKKIPIWVADYVLAGYGTGAVMGVPGHDDRDIIFATKYHLPVINVIENEIICNSGFLDGSTIEEAKEKASQWLEKHQAGERCVTYKLRDWLFSRQRYWGEPFPILHFEDGTKRALTLDELPLTPPDLTDYKPSGTGESPLAKVREWVEIVDPKTGRKALRETNTMPQWAGSCWYYLRFCDPHNTEAAWDHKKENYWMPVDLYVGGVEHAVLHLLYARFWHKVLYDCGSVSTLEPFQKLRNQGLLTSRSYRLPTGAYLPTDNVTEKDGEYFQIGTGIQLESQIEKMSKSKLNGVTPDEMIEEFGADSLRLYEMFMGPFDYEKVWNTDAVQGCHRFLNRFYNLITSDKVSDVKDEAGLKFASRTVFQVEKDIQAMSFNTAIARMMEFINDFQPLPVYSREALKMVAQALYPFAPHIAEEAWQHLGGQESLTYEPFPMIDPTYLIDATCIYVVQVNGKMRGKWDLPKDKTEAEIMTFIQTQPQIMKHLEGAIEKVIFVPNKLINIVIHV